MPSLKRGKRQRTLGYVKSCNAFDYIDTAQVRCLSSPESQTCVDRRALQGAR